MNLRSAFSALFVFLGATACAQKTDTTYFDADWKSSSKENSSYYRVIKTAALNKYDVEDYYSSGKIQMKGTYSSLAPEVKTGVFTWYYENGNKKTETNYEDNKSRGFKSWLENGEEDKREFVSLEKQPTFPGGMSNFYKYIAENFRYPRDLSSRPKGVIKISFIVDKDGTISDVYAFEGVHPLLDAEAVRVVENSPKWEPGIQFGKAVRVKYNVPISMK
ncbi:energy transducer TonB [Pedobacter sp. JY14-1]|uniref:energy transducer TonB n=1 Tax=Pedobacter sp. JY14-1 TaxID=3034151 RepID=UPI0023E34EDC|nr:energy transducer TonB [Pedobacter sp. JY14-1]